MNDAQVPMVTITQQEYDQLKEDSKLLGAIKAAGYGESFEDEYQDDEEEVK